MVLVLPGEADLAQAEALEGEEAEGLAGWEARGPARALLENVYVPVVGLLFPTRRDIPATSEAAPSAER